MTAVGGCPLTLVVPETYLGKNYDNNILSFAVGAEDILTGELLCGGMNENSGLVTYFYVCAWPNFTGAEQEITEVSVDDDSVLAVERVGTQQVRIEALAPGSATVEWSMMDSGFVEAFGSLEVTVSEVAEVQVSAECGVSDYERSLGGTDAIRVFSSERLFIGGSAFNEQGDWLYTGATGESFEDWFSFSPEAELETHGGQSSMFVTFIENVTSTMSWEYAGFNGTQVFDVESIDPETVNINVYVTNAIGNNLPVESYGSIEIDCDDYGCYGVSLEDDFNVTGDTPCNLPDLVLASETPTVCEISDEVSDDPYAFTIVPYSAGECRFTLSSEGGSISETFSLTIVDSA